MLCDCIALTRLSILNIAFLAFWTTFLYAFLMLPKSCKVNAQIGIFPACINAELMAIFSSA